MWKDLQTDNCVDDVGLLVRKEVFGLDTLYPILEFSGDKKSPCLLLLLATSSQLTRCFRKPANGI